MRYRKLDQDGDMQFGQQQANFFKDVPEAPAQAIRTRLMLFVGEWFLDVSSGTAYQGGILGKYTQDIADSVIRERILGSEGVTDIESYSSSINPETRTLVYSATVNTIYGQVTISGVL